MACVEVEGLAKYFGVQPVFRNLNFQLAAGEMVLLRGANGAGKSTLLQCISGLLPPDEGTIRILGETVFAGRGFERIRANVGIGYLPQQNLLFPALTIRENISVFSSFSTAEVEGVGSLIEKLGLAPHIDKRVQYCSQGIARKVGILRALLASSTLIVLDEPLANLDEHSAAQVLAILTLYQNQGAAILIASHQRLGEAYNAYRELHLELGSQGACVSQPLETSRSGQSIAGA